MRLHIIISHILSSLLFFFQAEDGIRYLVRSRGLGDVYKRQAQEYLDKYKDELNIIGHFGLGFYSAFMVSDKVDAVSYTHLTLPTSDLV